MLTNALLDYFFQTKPTYFGPIQRSSSLEKSVILEKAEINNTASGRWMDYRANGCIFEKLIILEKNLCGCQEVAPTWWNISGQNCHLKKQQQPSKFDLLSEQKQLWDYLLPWLSNLYEYSHSFSLFCLPVHVCLPFALLALQSLGGGVTQILACPKAQFPSLTEICPISWDDLHSTFQSEEEEETELPSCSTTSLLFWFTKLLL